MSRSSRSSYAGDPRWLTARFSSTCGKCDKQMPKGSQIWWYPKNKMAYCESCGESDSRVFDAAVADEDFMNSQFRG